MNKETAVIILAGGKGERLFPLTEHRAKPAVPFGGKYRIIDFILSNCLNSGLSRIFVLPQYKHASLSYHLGSAWVPYFDPAKGERLEILSPQMRIGNDWYQGTANAIYQNLWSLVKEKPKYVLILSGDQIYRMDYNELINFHKERQADLTVAGVITNKEVALRSGVLEIDDDQKIIGFEEKPKIPKPLPQDQSKYLVSMGIYVFDLKVLIDFLKQDDQNIESQHDFGKNIMPEIIKQKGRVFSYLFSNEKENAYWRDVGTIESYFDSNMDLVKINPPFNLYDRQWPWRTLSRQLPPAKVVFQGKIENSIISQGCIIDRGEIVHSILSPEVKIGKDCKLFNCIIMDGVVIENGVRIVNAIVDKENVIKEGSVIETGSMVYSERFKVSPSGIVVIPRGQSYI